jgi:hypothetical protein
MGLLADYMIHHNEITEMKFVEKNGNISFQKVLPFNDKNIKIGNNIVSKYNEKLNVFDYKDYIISFDDMQFGTNDKNFIKSKMFFLYEKIKRVEFADLRTERFVIKNERPKDINGNYIVDKAKGEISFEREMKLLKDETGEYQKEWTGNYILKKQYQRKKEDLNGAFFSLHLNEKKHPHIHCWIPKSVKMGKGYEAFRAAVREIVEIEGLILQEDNILFDKNDLKNEKNSKSLNEFRAARQVLSAYSYLLEEYQSLQGHKKSEFYIKNFENDIVHCRKYKISLTAYEHTETVNKKGKNQKIYSLSKLLETYTQYIAGSQDFIDQLIQRNNEQTKYKINFEKYTAKIEKQAKKAYIEQGIESIIEMFINCVYSKEKVPCSIKQIWREYASSTNGLKREIAEQMTEIYQSRYTKYRKINDKKLEKAKYRIELIIKKYDSLDFYEKVLGRFEELLKIETKSESNIINKLKQEFKLDILYIDKQDKTVLRFGNKDYETISLKSILQEKTTVYQVILENKNVELVNNFPDMLKKSVTEATGNEIAGMIAKETAKVIANKVPNLSIIPLQIAEITDISHDKSFEINEQKLFSVIEKSCDEIINKINDSDYNFNFEKFAVNNPVNFSKLIIDSIISAFTNLLKITIDLSKEFAINVCQKYEILKKRIELGNKIVMEQNQILGKLNSEEIDDINILKEQINKNDNEIGEYDCCSIVESSELSEK